MSELLASIEFSTEIKYVALIFALFVFPRFLIGFGVPYALTNFAMGFLFSFYAIIPYDDSVVSILSTLGIVSLFLFAGLEVDTFQLKRDKKVLIQHLVVLSVMLVLSSYAIHKSFGLDLRSATVFALAVLTPSTGFILDSLELSKLGSEIKHWIRSKAIAAEVLALILMFALIKSSSITELALSLLAMGALIMILPVVFVFFLKRVVPLAPQSEFGFLLITALVAGIVTKSLGAYYLMGAFIVGIIARRFELIQPEFSNKEMLHSLKFFTNFFTPFYFFHAGAVISPDAFSTSALVLGIVLLIVFIPVRVYMILFHRKLSLKENKELSFPVAASLLPNLVFGLVLAGILKTQFSLQQTYFGALIVYTVGSTLLPPILMHYFLKDESTYGLEEVEKSLGVISFHEKRSPEKDTNL